MKYLISNKMHSKSKMMLSHALSTDLFDKRALGSLCLYKPTIHIGNKDVFTVAKTKKIAKEITKFLDSGNDKSERLLSFECQPVDLIRNETMIIPISLKDDVLEIYFVNEEKLGFLWKEHFIFLYFNGLFENMSQR